MRPMYDQGGETAAQAGGVPCVIRETGVVILRKRHG